MRVDGNRSLCLYLQAHSFNIISCFECIFSLSIWWLAFVKVKQELHMDDYVKVTPYTHRFKSLKAPWDREGKKKNQWTHSSKASTINTMAPVFKAEFRQNLNKQI